MPGTALILPGHFGKLPGTGDFVTRGLSATFVRAWDRWLVRHLVPLFAAQDVLAAHPVLRFLLGPETYGPMAGVVLPSADSAGRRFPLTLAAPPPLADTGLAVAASGWFDAIEAAGQSARCGEISSDDLAARLTSLPFPDTGAAGDPVRRMAFWTRQSGMLDVDPEAPAAALHFLLSGCGEDG